MIRKKVQCPNCNKILSCSGNPGEIVRIVCTECRTEGKVTFIESDLTEDIAIEVSDLKKVYDDLIAVNNISFSDFFLDQFN